MEYTYNNREKLQQEIERLRPHIQFHISHGGLEPNGTQMDDSDFIGMTVDSFPQLSNSPVVYAYVQFDYHNLEHLLLQDLNVRTLNSPSPMFCGKLLTRENVEGRETCASVSHGSSTLSRDMCMFILLFLSLPTILFIHKS